ncbi:ornithine cyclodeaminase family protein [Thauera butanivorans]|uniref:ornithine cyclodeaminase family protein n=1 Tax=Thauera butanivorans TaxID=86174 RepID=UPI0008395FF7|nr:ornithine cyclodeaminase family protein [Thauera butanivorans]
MDILNQAQTNEHLPFDRLIPALEQMFVEGCRVPLRHNHAIENAAGEQAGTLLLMPAWQPGKRLGVKTVSIFPGNQELGLPGLHSVFILYDAGTGKPLALLDGDVITSRRTAAASALAARWLSRPESSSLLVVGAGRVAGLLAQAYRTVRPIETVHVWDIHLANSTKLVQSLREAGFDAHRADDLEQAVRRADIISCATLATEPLIRGQWLRPGTHLDLIGSFTPAMRESDGECFRIGTVFVDTEEAPMKSGDILEAVKEGGFTTDRIAATLQDLCRGRHPGRTGAGEITVYKAVGTALEDIAAASLAFDSHLIAAST